MCKDGAKRSASRAQFQPTDVGATTIAGPRAARCRSSASACTVLPRPMSSAAQAPPQLVGQRDEGVSAPHLDVAAARSDGLEEPRDLDVPAVHLEAARQPKPVVAIVDADAEVVRPRRARDLADLAAPLDLRLL